MKNNWEYYFPALGIRKSLCTLQFVVLLWIGPVMDGTAMGHAQNVLFSFKLKQATFEDLMKEIRQRSDYYFIYKDADVAEVNRLNVDFEQVDIHKILQECLNGTDLAYTIEDNLITIKRVVGKGQEKQTVQQWVVSGTIKDRQGHPLPGVTVQLKGTSLGVITDAAGKYRIALPQQKDVVLVFSFVGMEKKEVAVKEQKVIDLVLEEDNAELEEVVVTGIFTRKKESFTGSAATYTSQELKSVGNQNVIQSLKTLDPSLLVLDSKEWGSDPNRLPDMEIRGKTSIPGGLKEEYGTDPNQPLFILDGFETTLESIMNLSLDRIANVTILKDAASTAIYGSKAANGVVVVETVQPEAGKLRVNYRGDFTVSFADLSDYNLMNSAEKLEFEKLAGYYTENFAQFQIEKDQLYNHRLAEIARGVDTYWLNEPLRTTLSHRHNVYIEGGDEAMRYGLGVNYGSTRGVMKGSDKDIVAANLDLAYRIKRLRFSNKASFEHVDADREPVGFSSFAKANPYYRKVDKNNNITMVLDTVSGTPVFNPLYATTLRHVNNTKTLNLRDNLQIEWDILRELRLRGRIGLSYTDVDGEKFKSPKHPDFAETTELERGSYSESYQRTFSYDGDLTVTYGKLFSDKHQVNLVGGWKFQQNTVRSGGYSIVGFVNDFYVNPAFSSGYQEGSKPDYSKTMARSTSFYISANYAFNDRYLLDATYRADGSSVFGINQLFTNTWSLGLAWNLHRESFMQELQWLTLLKIRGSVGNPGNQNFNAYQSMKTYTYNSWLQNKFGTSAVIDVFGNPDLAWQKTMEKSLGLDLVLLDNRVRLNFDYYQKDTDPLLATISMPSSAGTGTLTTNIGRQIIDGFDGTFSISPVYRPQDRINWTMRFTFRHEKSEYRNIGKSLERLNQENIESQSLIRYYDGGSPDDLWAVKSLGIDPVTGNELFLKKDGTASFEWDVEDETIVGNSRPKLEGVVGTTLYYKGLSVSANFRYRMGGYTFASALFNKVENISKSNLGYNQDKRALYDRWQKPGNQAQFKSIANSSSTKMSSRFVVKEKTFSGESISVGYETTASWLKCIGASSMTLNAYMNDIFRASSIKEERGIEYPFARSVAFSLSLRF